LLLFCYPKPDDEKNSLWLTEVGKFSLLKAS